MPNDNTALNIGDSIVIRNEYGEHLHVIVAESSPGNSSLIMLVYISSKEKIHYKDSTTIIEAYEHPYIIKRSWVRYQNIIICSRSEVRKTIVKYYGKIDDKLLIRIQSGINSSDFVSGLKKRLFNEWKMDSLFRKANNQNV